MNLPVTEGPNRECISAQIVIIDKYMQRRTKWRECVLLVCLAIPMTAGSKIKHT